MSAPTNTGAMTTVKKAKLLNSSLREEVFFLSDMATFLEDYSLCVIHQRFGSCPGSVHSNRGYLLCTLVTQATRPIDEYQIDIQKLTKERQVCFEKP